MGGRGKGEGEGDQLNILLVSFQDMMASLGDHRSNIEIQRGMC